MYKYYTTNTKSGNAAQKQASKNVQNCETVRNCILLVMYNHRGC